VGIPVGALNRPCRNLSSIMSLSTGMVFFGMRNTRSVQAGWPDSDRIRWGGWTLSLNLPCFSHVHERAYSLFDSIHTSVFFCFIHNTLPIRRSPNLSGVDPLPHALWENLRINHLSQGPGIGTARVIALPLQSSPALVYSHPTMEQAAHCRQLICSRHTGRPLWCFHLRCTSPNEGTRKRVVFD
jgi:hypothetical protein